MARQRSTTMVFAAVLALGVALPARAQHAGDGYLFHEPNARVSIRGGYALASAHSDVFDQSIDLLTLNRRDFGGVTLGGEAAFPVWSRLDLSLDAGYSHARSGSEFRHFIDNNDKPIEQTTTFERIPLTANVRFYLAPPGRSVGRLAWIPAKVVPWVGGGAGMMWYRFRQQGDFVDFKTSNVVTLDLNSTDWTQMAQGMAGVDISLTPLMALRAESRYLWAKAPLNRSFAGFDRIDLSGVQATLGLTFRL